ncbi:IS1549, transposase family protein, partial [Mobiluncus mulieris ATCC 35239]
SAASVIDIVVAGSPGCVSGCGFDQAIGDSVFEQLVLARIVEPASKADTVRILSELGIGAAHRNTFNNCLRRCAGRDYRSRLATACFTHATKTGDLSLVLYDVTTLYFEAEKEDEDWDSNQGLRKIGYSKERRVDPQIVVGLLVDRNGFPLEIGCFEGNKAETKTILPVIKSFQERHNLDSFVMVATRACYLPKTSPCWARPGLGLLSGLGKPRRLMIWSRISIGMAISSKTAKS